LFAIITEIFSIEIGSVLVKFLLLTLSFSLYLFAGVIKTPVLSVDHASSIATIQVDRVDVGVSGFIVQRLSQRTSSILMSVEVIAFDSATKTATLKMLPFTSLTQNSLPSGNWSVEVGDIAILAFGYSRAILIAPTEDIYYKVTKSTSQVQWLHPDIFTTFLSFNGHPTPLQEDFQQIADTAAIGLIFFYVNQHIFTVDAKSMKVINITKAPLKQENVQLPFYSRITEIDANWFGEGSSEMEAYEPYYCSLLSQYNPADKDLHKICSLNIQETQKGESGWSITNIYKSLFQ